MKIITIISPDKLSMSMFYDFYKSVYVGEDTLKILDLNCIFSKEAIKHSILEFVELNKDYNHGIIKFKIKANTVIESYLELKACSYYMVKFDTFSSHPELLKDFDGKGSGIISRWNQNILKLDGGPR